MSEDEPDRGVLFKAFSTIFSAGALSTPKLGILEDEPDKEALFKLPVNVPDVAAGELLLRKLASGAPAFLLFKGLSFSFKIDLSRNVSDVCATPSKEVARGAVASIIMPNIID